MYSALCLAVEFPLGEREDPLSKSWFCQILCILPWPGLFSKSRPQLMGMRAVSCVVLELNNVYVMLVLRMISASHVVAISSGGRVEILAVVEAMFIS